MTNDPYQHIARVYDRLIGPFLSSVRRRTRTLVAGRCSRRPAQRILEVACGTGTQALEIAGAGWPVIAVDRSLPMLAAAARKRNGGGKRPLSLAAADAAALPFADGVFDTVLVQLSLHEMAGPVRAAAMGEILRVAAAGAEILAVDFLPSPGLTAANVALTAVEFAAGPDHFRNGRAFLRDGGIAALLAGFGLKIDRTWTFFGDTIGLVLAKKP